MLTVDKDTYVTLEEANTYISENYRIYDNLAVVWNVLEDSEKELYLKSSIRQMESLIYAGNKIILSSTNTFIGYNIFPDGLSFPRTNCYKPYVVPDEVKWAQIENALGLLKEHLSERTNEQIQIMSTLGAIKNWKYNKRELGDVGIVNSGAVRNKRLASAKAEQLLRPWIGG